MSNPFRPSNNEAFAERLRNAEARKLEELSDVSRRPRASDRRAALRMRKIEQKLEELEMQRRHMEIWE